MERICTAAPDDFTDPHGRVDRLLEQEELTPHRAAERHPRETGHMVVHITETPPQTNS